ncbi:PLC-like phosphodiesterase, TIM beta/alpha-barrel domain [Phaffia rhodozyma]|uniref:PLC-like phosphodiesterase, TIM beta/alpha-barrel domain n=1 Tax=Phaffia rhodozyma TaxID=264483 RepID=A0A0F7SUV6_PHARH|nr:PLC-like phosphodiesterase, TIM beta/alpha-barrel domain [Phaffia rhodozyma]
MLPFALVASTLNSGLVSASSYKPRASVCNGHAELCDRSYGNVTFIGSHDSYAISATQVAANQDQNITTQLNDGVRMLQVQAHSYDGSIHLCHTSCLLLDGGLFSDYLTEVNTWVVANPNEVLSILIVNSDNLNASMYGAVFETSGLDKVSYAPTKATTSVADWPTLGSMIDSGLRVVTFMDNSADFTTVPYIIDEFSNVVEDAYNAVEDSFPCTANRSTGTPENQLVLTNHYLDQVGSSTSIVTPNKSKLNQTNAETGTGSVGQGASNCFQIYARSPNFILLDFYDAAGLAPFNVAAELNDVSAPTNTVANYTGGDGSTSTSTKSTASTTSTSSSLSGAGPQFKSEMMPLIVAVAVAVMAGSGLMLA